MSNFDQSDLFYMNDVVLYPYTREIHFSVNTFGANRKPVWVRLDTALALAFTSIITFKLRHCLNL